MDARGAEEVVSAIVGRIENALRPCSYNTC